MTSPPGITVRPLLSSLCPHILPSLIHTPPELPTVFLYLMRSTILWCAVMLSAAARAFTVSRGGLVTAGAGASAGCRLGSVHVPSALVRVPVARSMTAEAGEGKTVVDICTEKISAALETDDVKVVGAYDDPNGSHITVEVYSDKFDGKRLVQRQQMVYKALWEELGSNAVHAVDSMVCKTLAEK